MIKGFLSVLFAVFIVFPLFAQEEVKDDLGDADNATLPVKDKIVKEQKEPEKGKAFENRVIEFHGYVLGTGSYLDYYSHQASKDSKNSALELNGMLNFKPSALFLLHLDLGAKAFNNSGYSSQQVADDKFLANEFFISSQIENFNLTAGKKRTVIGLGSMLDPLDIVNAQKSLPGQPEQKEGQYFAGINFTRLFDSKDFSQAYLDLIYYPGVIKNKSGMIDEMNKTLDGFMARGGGVFFKTDVSLYYIYKYEKSHYGFSASRYLADSLEIKVEGLFFQGRNPYFQNLSAVSENKYYLNGLMGIKYFFWSKGIFSLDYYYQGEGLNSSEWESSTSLMKLPLTMMVIAKNNQVYEKSMNLALRRHYLLSNLSFASLWDYFNLNLTAIYSPEDSAFFIFPKIDFLAGDQSTLGIGAIFLTGKKNSQYQLMPFEYTLTLDMTIHF